LFLHDTTQLRAQKTQNAVTFAAQHTIHIYPTKIRPKEHNNRKTLTYASETWTVTKRDRKQLKVFQRKVYRIILGPVYDNEKENWRILTSNEIYARVEKSYNNRQQG
jgi:hypothetical protein